ncbi:Rpn family recombination-promoting nuclease/putative transposase [Agathobacter sp.]
MGTKDSKAKEYLSDNTRFSEICNYVLFDGERIIKSEELKEQDSTEILSIFGIDRKQIIKQKWRDLLRSVSIKYTGNMYVILIGIEAQTDVHYAMPVKNMIYDALNYGDQVNEVRKHHNQQKDYKKSEEFLSGFTSEDKLTPVITITLYLGTGEWNAPRSLIDMMPAIDKRVLPFINDYKINLLNPSDITDFSKFQTGLRPLFEVLKNARDERRLNEVISSDETFKNVDVETIAAINLFAGMDIKIEKEDEVLNMCKAWDEHKNRGIQEGIQVGKKEGIQAGIQEGRCLEIYSLVQDGILDPEVGAKRINMSLQDFEEKMQKAGYKLPELV